MTPRSTVTTIPSIEQVNLARGITLSPKAYVPDHWTAALMRGIEKLSLAGKRLLDVGVGPGSLALELLVRHPEIEKIYGSDICGDLTELATQNAQRQLANDHGRFYGCPGDLNLLSWLATSEIRSKIDLAYSCLPQLKVFSTLAARPDIWAHYYNPREYSSVFDLWHLGLNDVFLRQSFEFLPQDAGVVLILSGRPPLHILEALFARNKFNATILHQEIMQQDSGSSLEQLVRDEELLISEGWDPFIFFRDPTGTSSINAAHAWELMRNGQPVFHRVYVMLGSRGVYKTNPRKGTENIDQI